jgi:Lar family restriction alleviation protein
MALGDLLPCPFCGSSVLSAASSIGRGTFIYCEKCDAEGPTTNEGNGAGACELWNKRVTNGDQP